MTTQAPTAIEAYTAEFVAVASAWMNGHTQPYLDHCRLYSIYISDSQLVRHATICKAVTGNVRFPMEIRTRAKRWLLAHHMQPFDDGDVPV